MNQQTIKTFKYLYIFISLGLIVFISQMPIQQLSDTILSIVKFQDNRINSHVKQILTPDFLRKVKLLISIGLLVSIVLFVFSHSIFSSLKYELKSLYTLVKDKWAETNKKVWLTTNILYISIILIVCSATPLHMDTAYTLEYFTTKFPLLSLVNYPIANNHILYSFLSSILYSITGSIFISLRLQSIVYAILSLNAIVLYFNKRFDKRKSIASLLVLCSYYPIMYSFLGRGYSLCMLCTLIATLLSLSFTKKNKLTHPYSFIIVCIAGLYTLPVFIYTLAPLGLILLIHVDNTKGVIITGLKIVISTTLLYTPIIWLYGAQRLLRNPVFPPKPYHEILNHYLEYLYEYAENNLLIVTILISSFFFFAKNTSLKRLFVLSVLVLLAIPLIQRVFPPFRGMIMIYPILLIFVLYTIDVKPKYLYVIAIGTLLSLSQFHTQYMDTMKYTLESDKAIKIASSYKKKIYLLDGPRSYYNWKLAKDDIEFIGAFYKDPLDKSIYNDTSYILISEDRHSELDMSNFTIIDTSSMFTVLLRNN